MTYKDYDISVGRNFSGVPVVLAFKQSHSGPFEILSSANGRVITSEPAFCFRKTSTEDVVLVVEGREILVLDIPSRPSLKEKYPQENSWIEFHNHLEDFEDVGGDELLHLRSHADNDNEATLPIDIDFGVLADDFMDEVFLQFQKTDEPNRYFYALVRNVDIFLSSGWYERFKPSHFCERIAKVEISD